MDMFFLKKMIERKKRKEYLPKLPLKCLNTKNDEHLKTRVLFDCYSNIIIATKYPTFYFVIHQQFSFHSSLFHLTFFFPSSWFMGNTGSRF